MAKYFREFFGDKLITEPIPEWKNKTEYPSPEELKHRVIIKHKKLKPGETEVLLNSKKSEDDVSNSKHNGTMLLKDPYDGKWIKV